MLLCAARAPEPRSRRVRTASLAALGSALAVLFATAAFPALASASLADEQAQGKALAAEVNAGKKSCGDLSSNDFEVIGEYVMGHFVGSTSAHAAMNARMTAMMGSQGEARMHQQMGERFTGCAGASSNGGSYGMGPGMMGGDSNDGDWGAMMGSGDWNWMMGGDWRNMNQSDWQRLQRRWMGTNAAAVHKGDGTSVWMYVAIALAAVVCVLLVLQFRGRRPAPPQPDG